VLISSWETRIVPIIEDNRDAAELDITCMEARARNIVAGNETYIGRRVISGNIQRELPTFIQYLSGSYRHVVAKSLGPVIPANVLSDIEVAFTSAFRVGNWLEPHIQVANSDMLHGRGVFMVIPAPDTQLGTAPVYVPPEDFIFPTETREMQNAPMGAVRYVITQTQFKDWAQRYGWDKTAADAILQSLASPEQMNVVVPVFLVLHKVRVPSPAPGAPPTKRVESFWFYNQTQAPLTASAPLDCGYRGPDGKAVPCADYPIFPVYYNITENPRLIERKGRAHFDMHDQEALTMMWTGFVNGMMRASEVYIALKESGMTENPEIVQTEFIMDPGRILKKPVEFYSPPWPDTVMLQACQALSTENANSAGQVDFAAQARKDSRKTAKELSLAAEQADKASTVPLTMFAIGYATMLEFMWAVVTYNINSGFNKQFLADKPEVRALIAQGAIVIRPAGDIDYVERQDKLKLYTNYYQLFAGTAVGNFFLKKILELAFPDEYQQMAPMLEDNSRQMGAALLQIITKLPIDQMVQGGLMTAETAQQLQTIIAEAQKTFVPPDQNSQPEQNVPTATLS